jgi:hypothetical protein
MRGENNFGKRKKKITKMLSDRVRGLGYKVTKHIAGRG